MRWDGWELYGLAGEGLFFARMLAQWVASERVKKPVIPVAYWYMSLAGAVILLQYAIHIGSFAVLLPQIAGLFFYCRGLQLEYGARARQAKRSLAGFDRPEYPWPRISVIVPVHNEEKTLADTFRNVSACEYPGEWEIIAALNGCTDNSPAIAGQFPVRVVSSERSGMSFGKNLGARAASGEMFVFVDADTRVPADALRLLAEAAAGREHFIGTVRGRPDRGGGVVRVCFWIANHATRRKRAHAPGGVMLMDRGTFESAGGFDESLPQGTSTDMIWRGIGIGAEYVFVDSFSAETSIRRFEKTGIFRQMLSWRSNHRNLAGERHDVVREREYEDVR